LDTSSSLTILVFILCNENRKYWAFLEVTGLARVSLDGLGMFVPDCGGADDEVELLNISEARFWDNTFQSRHQSAIS
jgi:hypothetical protein